LKVRFDELESALLPLAEQHHLILVGKIPGESLSFFARVSPWARSRFANQDVPQGEFVNIPGGLLFTASGERQAVGNLIVVDVAGRMRFSATIPAGSAAATVSWLGVDASGTHLGRGVYFARANVGGVTFKRTVVLVK
jgi:hypothetical protein